MIIAPVQREPTRRTALERPEIVIAELRRHQVEAVPFLKEEQDSLKKRIDLLKEQEKRLVRLCSLGEVDEAVKAQIWVYPDRVEVRGSIPISLTIEQTWACRLVWTYSWTPHGSPKPECIDVT
jgi:hypothetical protein